MVVDEETGAVLGLVERERAFSTVHEGAIYLHLGEQYLVASARPRRARPLVAPVARRLVHAGEEGDGDGDRGAASAASTLGVELHFGRDRR